jgi:hypothetical protein
MRTIDFETILAQALQQCGLDRDNISVETFNQFRDFANFRLKFGFEYDVWPQLIRTTQLPITHVGNVHSITIPADGVVTNAEGTFKVDIGTVFQVTLEDPRSTGKVKELAFTIDESELSVGNGVFRDVERIIINEANANFAFVTYRIDCPELIGDLWTSQTYYPTQQAYWAYANGKYFAPTTGINFAGRKGNFWRCVRTATTAPNIANNTIPTSSDLWERIRIPLFLGNYIIKGCHADWLRSELQIEYAQAIEREAMAVLDMEVNKAIIQQGVQPRLKFNQIY